jgi:glycosyltransferase involved in cell wall biosynthesis
MKLSLKNSVSVIIPTYNRSGLIGRAIKSVLAAMSPGDEVLVIDDGSTDDTAAVVRSFGDAIRYIRIENSGPGAARNLGIRLAECPLVAFLDSDDEWLPDKMELQRKVMERFPEVVYCFGNVRCRLPNGDILHDILSLWRTDPNVGCSDSPTHLREILGPGVPFSSIAALPKGCADFNIHIGDLYPALMEVLYVSSNAAMVRKELGGASFRNAEDLRLMEDWVCFAELSKIGPAAYLDCEAYVQTVHAGPRLTGVGNLAQATGRIAILQRVWGADEQFLMTHSARYKSLLAFQHLRRAILLIEKGQLNEAKEDLQVADGPLAYRLLASLPSGLVKIILGGRRKVMGLLK